MVLIDSNVLLDVLQNDPLWSTSSITALRSLSTTDELAINAVIFAEVSIRFASRLEVERALNSVGVTILHIPIGAAFLAGKAFVEYRKLGGTKTGVLPDFLIGAHASVLKAKVVTRDLRRYRTYFPTVQLITP